MTEFETIEHEFYEACYPCANSKPRDKRAMWKEIKKNKELLKWAIGVYKEKWNNDFLRATTICEFILSNYDSIDKEIYDELVKVIYTYTDIARCKTPSNFSYLEMTLWNPNLKLTNEQKQYVLDEFRSQASYTNGTYEFGLRYWILRNSNWTEDEKYKLVYEFYDDEESYQDIFESWEYDILNSDSLNQQSFCSSIDLDYIYDYTDEQLMKLCRSEDNFKEIKELIEFCRLMKKLRPTMWPLKENYKLSDENVNRIIGLRKYLAEEQHEYLTYWDLMDKLKWAMNCDEMQIWLIENDLKGIKTSLDEDLTKFFELTANQRIITIFEINKNVNDVNLEATETYFRTRTKENEN